MAREEVSPEVRRFIQDTISSVEQLEVLLFMMSNADKDWSAAQVSDRVRLQPESVEARLRELADADILVKRLGQEATYCYAPKSSAVAEELGASLSKAYQEGRDTVIQLIYTRPMDNIRIFADAFRIKRKD